MIQSRNTNGWSRSLAIAMLALSLASVSAVFLLSPALVQAAADDDEVAKKAEWQDRFRTIRNNAVRMRDNATKLRRAYSASQHSNYPRGGERERFKQQVIDTERKASDYEAQMASFIDEARQNQIPPGWIYEVEDEPVDPGSPAAAGDEEATHRVGAAAGRNPVFVEGARDEQDEAMVEEEPADDRGESFDDFGDDRDDQYRIEGEEADGTTADDSKSDF